MEWIFFEMQMVGGGPCVPGLGRGSQREWRLEERANPSSRPTMEHQLYKLQWPWVITPTPAPGFLWGRAGEASSPCGLRVLRSSPPPFASIEGKESP